MVPLYNQPMVACSMMIIVAHCFRIPVPSASSYYRSGCTLCISRSHTPPPLAKAQEVNAPLPCLCRQRKGTAILFSLPARLVKNFQCFRQSSHGDKNILYSHTHTHTHTHTLYGAKHPPSFLLCIRMQSMAWVARFLPNLQPILRHLPKCA